MEDIAKKAVEYWGSGSIMKADNKNDFHEAGLLHLDNTKARTKLGWAPLMNGIVAVKTTIDWYKNVHLQPGMSKEITGKQIIEYMKGI